MAKIAVCGYWRYSSTVDYLAALHDIRALFTSPKEPLEGANLKRLGDFPVHQRGVTPADLALLAREGVERLYVGGYPFRIPQWEGVIGMAVNLHPSLLPEGRGTATEAHTILKKLQRGGVTLHRISHDWDEGDIIAQESFGLARMETALSLTFKTRLAALELIRRFEEDPQGHLDRARPQQGKASYWPSAGIEAQTIAWDWPVSRIARHVRAFSNAGARAWLGGHAIRLRQVCVWQQAHQMSPGCVIDHYMGGEMLIAAGDGFVCVESYEVEG